MVLLLLVLPSFTVLSELLSVGSHGHLTDSRVPTCLQESSCLLKWREKKAGCVENIIISFRDVSIQSHFLPYPPYDTSQRTSHPCIDVPSPFTASCLHTSFSVRILARSSIPGSPCNVGAPPTCHSLVPVSGVSVPRSDLPPAPLSGKEPVWPFLQLSAPDVRNHIRIPQ